MNEKEPLNYPRRDDDRAAIPSSQINVEVGALSVKGSRYEKNEDHYMVARFERSRQTLLTNISPAFLTPFSSEIGYALIVADGIGQRNSGEIASKEAISYLVQLAEQTPDWILTLEADYSKQVLSRMRHRFNEISRHFEACANRDRSLAGMGSTITLAASIGRNLIIGHIGDTRCYLLRGRALVKLTRDQTFTQALMDAGTFDSKFVQTHPMRDTLTGIIETDGEFQPAQLNHHRLMEGDQLLLCSDGLTDIVDESQMLSILSESGSADLACRVLIQHALTAGCTDDATAIVCRYSNMSAPSI